MPDAVDVKNARVDRSLIERALTDAGASIHGVKRFRCPFHEDTNPSAGLFQGKDDGWRFKCHGCGFSGDVFDVVMRNHGVQFPQAASIVCRKGRSVAQCNGKPKKPASVYSTFDDALKDLRKWKVNQGATKTTVHEYANADGSVTFKVVRFEFSDRKKRLWPVHDTGKGWMIGDPRGKLSLYRLPEIEKARNDGKTIFVVEGESCADALWRLGIPATTSAHGSDGAAKIDWTPLVGADVVIQPDNDDAGEKYASAVVELLFKLNNRAKLRIVRLPNLPPGGDIVDHIDRLDSRADEDIAAGIGELVAEAQYEKPSQSELPTSRQELVIVPLSDVEPTEQPYLWQDRIPLASCTLIGGAQGTTKNLFAYDLISRVTTGEKWPDNPGGQYRAPQSVILLEAEEHLESSIRPRVAAAGADLTSVHFVMGAPTKNADRTRLVSIQEDALSVERAASRIGEVALIVVSPITAYLGNVEQNSNEQVRNEIIHPLKQLAERLCCSVVILKHPNKDYKNLDPIGRIGGSAAWSEAMRCVIFIGIDPDEDPDEKNPRRCAQWIKFSIGPKPDPLSWKVHVTETGAPAIYYVSDPVTFTAVEMLAGRRKNEERKSKRELAAEWITETLKLGPMTAATLNDAAMAAVNSDRKFSMDSFERARKDLRNAGRLILERKPEVNPPEWWYWLADQSAPDWYVRDGGE